jgi:hypothetical protein
MATSPSVTERPDADSIMGVALFRDEFPAGFGAFDRGLSRSKVEGVGVRGLGAKGEGGMEGCQGRGERPS